LKLQVRVGYLCSKNPNSVRYGLCGRAVHTNGGVPSSRFGGPRSGTKDWPSEIWAKSLARVAPFNFLLLLPPYPPPIVFQTLCRRIEESSFRSGINCQTSDQSYACDKELAQLPFHNLAISAGSNGSLSVLSMLPSISGATSELALQSE